MRPETDRRISESMRFFSCLHGRGPYPICATWEEKNRNWVTWTMQCAASLSQRSLYCLYRQEHVQTVTAQQNNAWISDSDRMLHTDTLKENNYASQEYLVTWWVLFTVLKLYYNYRPISLTCTIICAQTFQPIHISGIKTNCNTINTSIKTL